MGKAGGVGAQRGALPRHIMSQHDPHTGARPLRAGPRPIGPGPPEGSKSSPSGLGVHGQGRAGFLFCCFWAPRQPHAFVCDAPNRLPEFVLWGKPFFAEMRGRLCTKSL